MALPLEAPYEQYQAVRALAEEVRRLPQYLQAYIDKAAVQAHRQRAEQPPETRPESGARPKDAE